MIFKVGLYRQGKADLIRHVERWGIDSLSFYCATVGFPVAAAAVFCIEEWPQHKEVLEKKLEALKEFYGYEAIEE
jgi:hypothetical protein